MNGLQVFALIVLPVMVAALGWILAFAFAPRRRASNPEEHSLPGTHQRRV